MEDSYPKESARFHNALFFEFLLDRLNDFYAGTTEKINEAQLMIHCQMLALFRQFLNVVINYFLIRNNNSTRKTYCRTKGIRLAARLFSTATIKHSLLFLSIHPAHHWCGKSVFYYFFSKPKPFH